MEYLSKVRAGKYLLPVVLAGLLSACGGSDTKIVEKDPIPNPTPTPTPVEDGESGQRLLITKPGHHDHVLVYDLESREEIANLHVDGTISGLHASPSYRYAVAVQGVAGTVNFIDSGVEWEDHGDHGHLHLSEPKVLDLALSGTKPAHVTKHGDQTVIFFDGVDGAPAEVRILTESGLADGSVLASYVDDTYQHGAAQAWGDYLVTTVRDVSVASPGAVKALERHGDHFHDLQRFDEPQYACPRLHGSAQNIGYIAFGCGDGVLLLEPHGDHFHAHKVASDVRISSVFGHPGSVAFVGAGRNSNDDPVALFVVNPATETISRLAYTKTPRAYSFAEDGDVFVVLDTEGGLTAWDTHTWQLKGARLQVTAAAEATGEVFRLTASADGEKLYVADVGAKKILVVNVDHWHTEADETITLDFAPGAILWLGTDEEDDGHHH